jgi:hypothetical protein
VLTSERRAHTAGRERKQVKKGHARVGRGARTANGGARTAGEGCMHG